MEMVAKLKKYAQWYEDFAKSIGGPTTPAPPTAIEVSPNPAHDFLKIRFTPDEKGETGKMFDASGKLCAAFVFDEVGFEKSVDVSDYNAGVYILKIADKPSIKIIVH